jgi:hypothetical protein
LQSALSEEGTSFVFDAEAGTTLVLWFRHGFDLVGVTHGLAWVVGTELVARLQGAANEPEWTAAAMRTLESAFSLFLRMQDDAKFRSGETCSMLSTFPFRRAQSGPRHGALIFEDPVLRGTHWRADGHFDEEGQLHDEHFWPQHFLVIYPLHGAEYSALPGISGPVFAAVLSTRYRLLVTRAERESHLDEFSAELEARRLRHASRHLTNGVAMYLVLRKLGRELDIVIGARSISTLLTALLSVFDKPNVPKKVHRCVRV